MVVLARLLFLSLALLPSVFLSVSYGADKNGASSMYFSIEIDGKPAHQCSTFVHLRKNPKQNARSLRLYSVWLQGYATRYNETTPNTCSILNFNADAGDLFMEQYCIKNPFDDYSEAVRALLAEKYSARKQQCD